MTTRPLIYLAGPDVFAPNAREIGQSLKNICLAHGCEGLFPLDDDIGRDVTGRERVLLIAAGCTQMIDRCDAIVANLSPWRGPHVDDGTAFELGFALRAGKPLFGYSSDLSPLLDRIQHDMPLEGTTFRDHRGYEIENFGQPFNAMISGTLMMRPAGTAEVAIANAAAYLREIEARG